MKKTIVFIDGKSFPIQEFIEDVPLEIIMLDDKIDIVGVRWGWTQYADENYGRKRVLRVLDWLEKTSEGHQMLDKSLIPTYQN